jgi:hypothetical protein
MEGSEESKMAAAVRRLGLGKTSGRTAGAVAKAVHPLGHVVSGHQIGIVQLLHKI